MSSKKQVLPKKTKIFKAWVVDHYTGKVTQISGGPWTGRAHAEDALEQYFKNNPPQTVTDYDVGGYIEEVDLDLGVNPRG